MLLLIFKDSSNLSAVVIVCHCHKIAMGYRDSSLELKGLTVLELFLVEDLLLLIQLV